jgi:hypothetical protein
MLFLRSERSTVRRLHRQALTPMSQGFTVAGE